MATPEGYDLPEWANRMGASLERQTEVLSILLGKAWTVALGALALFEAKDIIVVQPNPVNVVAFGGSLIWAARRTLVS